MQRNGHNQTTPSISTENKPIPVNIINKVIKSICKIIIKKEDKRIYGTGFFLNIPDSGKYLCTNNHVISKETLNEVIYLEIDNHKKRKLKINNRNIKYFEKPKDITIIEIKNDDRFYKYIEFLNYDINYKNGYEKYNNADIFSIGYPLGKDPVYANGKIIGIDNNEFSHTIPTNNGSSGSPIILLHDDIKFIKVIGIHKESGISIKVNYGTFITEIFNVNNKTINENIVINNKTPDDNKICAKINILKKNNKINLNLIKNICAIKITYLFKRLLKLKIEAYHKLYKCLTTIPLSKNKVNLNKFQSDVDLAPEETCIYLGTSFNQKKDGLGLETFENSNAKYFGVFKNGQRVNAGVFNIKNNFKNYFYYGEIQGIYASGFGMLIDKIKNKKYEGMWENSMKNGYGIEKYEDNTEYRGCFLNGKKEGIGIIKWNDNSFYEGEWKENKMHGYGIYKFSDGSEYKGEWKKGLFDGLGEFTCPGLKKYYGFFRKDKRYGFGIEVWLNKSKAFIGFWKNNNIDGFGKYFVNEKIKYGIWKNGELVETFKERDFLKKVKIERKNYLRFYKLGDYNAVLSVIKGKL